jgi:hypothetical protein
MRLHLVASKTLAHDALGQIGKTLMPCRRFMLAGMAYQEPRRPQLVRIAQLLRLAAGDTSQLSASAVNSYPVVAARRASMDHKATARSMQRWTVW